MAVLIKHGINEIIITCTKLLSVATENLRDNVHYSHRQGVSCTTTFCSHNIILSLLWADFSFTLSFAATKLDSYW